MLFTLAGWIERLFLPIAVGCSALALAAPPLFTWIAPHIALGLGIIMFGMGLTLDFGAFARVLPRWPLVAAGAALQYTVMPLAALGVARLFGLGPEAALGLALVGACPGGTASNVITYLARGNVALSVTMTIVSTALAPILTPAIVYLLHQQHIDIDFWAMARSVFWIVVFPLVDGLVLRRLFLKRLTAVVRIFPAVSIVTISLVIACVVGLNQCTILARPWMILAAVTLHSLAGFGAGWCAGRLLSKDKADAVALSVEVGMQNSGLGVALAHQFFTAAAALPGALFSLMQNLLGVSLARVWTSNAGPGGSGAAREPRR
ncbi:MAG: bile acid:sodium symporter family protein [Desulfovibrionaceae bacterium]